MDMNINSLDYYPITESLLGVGNSERLSQQDLIVFPEREPEKPNTIPDSAKYSPVGIVKRTFINWGDGLKAEENKGVNPKGARHVDVYLAKTAQKVAEEMDTVGQCYTGVKHALWNAGVLDDYADMPRGGAKNATTYFDSHPEQFVKLDVEPEAIKDLPAGRILVYKNANKDIPGHIAITNGNGQAMSDFTDNLGWIEKHGEGSTVEAYKLSDGWHQDLITGKLYFYE